MLFHKLNCDKIKSMYFKTASKRRINFKIPIMHFLIDN